MIRRYGEAVKQGQTYRFRPGVYAILPRGGDLLLTYQASPHYEVQLPGGGIDPGENPIDALHREVFEETGWKIGDIRKIGAYRRFCYMPEYDKWAEKLCHIYMARPVHRLGPPSEPDHTPLWMPMAEAARTIASPGDRAFVADLYSRSRFSTR
jgi:8-oxo-dGTP diphosphatase